MNQDFLLFLLKETLITAALVAAPVLLSIMIVGLLVSILQVATQIQEMTLTFIPKLIVTVLVLLAFGGWMSSTLSQYAMILYAHAASL